MRYLPLTDTDRRAMLTKIGVPSVDSLYRDVPESARLSKPVDLPAFQGELEVERAKNRREAAGSGAIRYALWCGFAPLVFWMGVRDVQTTVAVGL